MPILWSLITTIFGKYYKIIFVAGVFLALIIAYTSWRSHIANQATANCQQQVKTAATEQKIIALTEAQKLQATLTKESDDLNDMDDEDLKASIAWKKKYEAIIKKYPVPADCQPDLSILRNINSANKFGQSADNNKQKSIKAGTVAK